MGSAIFNWSCYSIPNTMMVEYLLRSLIFSRDQHIFIIYLFTEKNKYIHIQSNDFSLWLLCTPTFGLKGWMAWENSRKGTRGFCILIGLRKRCGAVWNFYFKSWKQQLQLWLKAKRGQLLKKKKEISYPWKKHALFLSAPVPPVPWFASCGSGILPMETLISTIKFFFFKDRKS